jgi:hypothetical protein
MSIEAIEWAIKYAPPMPAQLVATLAGLANHADSKGRGAFPSLATLAAYTCKSERSVRRDLRDLAELKLIRPGDPSKTAHLPSDKRPEVYDLAIELKVPGGRAGDDEGTRASARTLASSRARGGRRKPSSGDTRADVDVRGDADVRADVDVTSGGTSTSQRGDVGVRQTVIEPSVEPPPPLPPQRTAPTTGNHGGGGSSADPNINRAQLLLSRLPAPWTLGPADAAAIAPQLAETANRLGWPINDQLAAAICTNPGGMNNPAEILAKKRIPNLLPYATVYRPPSLLPPACPACLAENPAAAKNKHWRARDGRRCTECHPDAAPAAA